MRRGSVLPRRARTLARRAAPRAGWFCTRRVCRESHGLLRGAAHKSSRVAPEEGGVHGDGHHLDALHAAAPGGSPRRERLALSLGDRGERVHRLVHGPKQQNHLSPPSRAVSARGRAAATVGQRRPETRPRSGSAWARGTAAGRGAGRACSRDMSLLSSGSSTCAPAAGTQSFNTQRFMGGSRKTHTARGGAGVAGRAHLVHHVDKEVAHLAYAPGAVTPRRARPARAWAVLSRVCSAGRAGRGSGGDLAPLVEAGADGGDGGDEARDGGLEGAHLGARRLLARQHRGELGRHGRPRRLQLRVRDQVPATPRHVRLRWGGRCDSAGATSPSRHWER